MQNQRSGEGWLVEISMEASAGEPRIPSIDSLRLALNIGLVRLAGQRD